MKYKGKLRNADTVLPQQDDFTDDFSEELGSKIPGMA